jgi:hypothetical protein
VRSNCGSSRKSNIFIYDKIIIVTGDKEGKSMKTYPEGMHTTFCVILIQRWSKKISRDQRHLRAHTGSNELDWRRRRRRLVVAGLLARRVLVIACWLMVIGK